MVDDFATFQTSRLIYATCDFYSAAGLRELYEQWEQVMWELFGHSNFTLFFPNKIEKRLAVEYSTFLNTEQAQQYNLKLDQEPVKSILEPFDESGILVTNSPDILNHWPFPVSHCAMLRDGQTILGMLVIHKPGDDSFQTEMASIEILEPIVKHFTQALMRQKSEQQFEKLLDETNAKLVAINEVGELLGHLELNTLLSKIVSLALQLIQAEVANLMFLESGKLTSQVEWGLTDAIINGIHWEDDSLLADRVLEHHMPVLVENLQTDDRFHVDESSRQIQSIVSIPLFTNSKDLGVLNVVNTSGGESFSAENMATLQTVASLASTAIENAMLHKEAIEREVFREQLRIARQIWEYILPRSIPKFPGATLFARSVPASVVGGDFYDFIPLSDDRLGIVIADVSGKGIPAAMIMNMAKSVLHIEALRGNSPGKVLQTVNDLLVDSTRLDSFVTLTYAIFDPNKKRVVMTNAGHNPCLVYRSETGECEYIPSNNMPLAIMSGLEYSQAEIDFSPGDCIIFYTDGVTEAMNHDREMYEMERLQNLVQGTGRSHSAEEILDRIYSNVNEFAGEMAQHDDTTVVVFRANPA